eukprot:TRINITY_DN17163_c0_g2_i1.p1 TRINITY_DN17163_c0_g2~~TRINITY_DN17163_c0_g2_i1.p1  ORF type:complete len:917 (-),score=149.53 TRINITY_DN17163_c0_g2_i1:293-3043(-)
MTAEVVVTTAQHKPTGVPQPIRVGDVVKAVDICIQRLGCVRRSCSTLRAWAAVGRVTPAGQLLTVEAVDAGIERWFREHNRSAEIPSVMGAAPSGVAKRAANAGSSNGVSGQVAASRDGKSTGPTNKKGMSKRVQVTSSAAEKTETSVDETNAKEPTRLSGLATSEVPVMVKVANSTTAGVQMTAAEPAVGTAGQVAISSEAASVKRRKLERSQQEARVQELTNQRLAEVLAEIDSHMEGILGRKPNKESRHESSAEAEMRCADELVERASAEVVAAKVGKQLTAIGKGSTEALEAWRAAPSDADMRDLFSRLVHNKQDDDVRVPEELNAELLPHQVEGLEWLASLYANSLHGILADEMGLGKTIQTISLLLYIKERKGNVGPHLIVAPKSTLGNWQTEFTRFAPGYKVLVMTGDAEGREACLDAFRKGVERCDPVALVTNYEQVYRNKALITTEWQLVVVDEGHRLKNPDTQLHKAMVQLRCRMRLLLTGTPLQNSVGELWALLHYLLPDLFSVLMDFKTWFARPFRGIEGLNEFEVQLNPEQEQQVIARMHTLLAPFLLQRLKCEALADRLPARIEETIRVPLSAWQRSSYKDLERRTIRLMTDGGEGTESSVRSEDINNALMQLRKLVLHPYLFQESFASDENLFRTSGKMEALDRILPKLLRFKHKVLIFSQFTTMLDILQAFLRFRSFRATRLDGQTAHEARQLAINSFTTDPGIFVFLLSARAGGLGLNLQAADTVILFDLDWNPQNDRQAVARAHRVGQTQEVRVIRLVTDSPVERHIEQRCQEKLEMEKKIMGAGMFRRTVTTEQRRSALRGILGLSEQRALEPDLTHVTVAAEDAATMVSSTTTFEQLNRAIARNSEELAEFERMDAELFALRKRGEDEASVLVSCNRLMRPDEVPSGFSFVQSTET